MAAESQSEAVSWREILNRHHGASVALVSLAVFLHAVDSTMVATLVPEIVEDIGGVHVLAWTVVLYEMGSIVAGAASGLLALRLGLKRPMLIAALVFAAGCATSAMAPDMRTVLAGRVLQGLGGGGLIAFSFVSMSLMFPKRLMPRVMATVSIVWGASAFLGPLAGALFAEFSHWRVAFWTCAVLALGLGLWIARSRVSSRPTTPPEQRQQRFPFFRLLFLCAGVLLIASGGIFVSPVLTPLFVLTGIAALGWFLVLDGRKDSSRLLPTPAVGLGTPASTALTMIVCFTAATIAITVYGPILITRIHGSSILMAGYVVAASSVGWSVAAVVFSGRSERHDANTILIGMGVLIVSIVGFVWSVPAGPLWLIILFAFTEGAGFGMSYTFILRRVLSQSPAEEAERISASIPTTQRLGYAIGAAFVGIVANTTGFDEHTSAGDAAGVARWIFIACLPFALIGSVAAFRFCRVSR